MDIEAVAKRIHNIWPILDERQRRLLAASEAQSLGHGGVTAVSEICGLSRVTISKGIKELDEELLVFEGNKIRRPGSGRPSLVDSDPTLMTDLEAILDSTTRGDPESIVRWTCLSTRKIADALVSLGHKISYRKVDILLKDLGYSLQSNRKVEEGKQHEDRNEQFMFINDQVKKALKANQPVISVDTKKKELVGNYKNQGTTWRPKGDPVKVNVYDFIDLSVPKAIPYGIYDIGCDTGFVNVGTDHDTSSFAVASIRGWWKNIGRKSYPSLKYILITADGGGSNGYRLNLWKYELQKLANELRVPIRVCHFPPGTSKWNKVEHRLFSFISTNWKGQPLRDYETVVNLISHTYTAKGLKVICKLDRRKYKVGLKITKEQKESINIEKNKFHGEWNYTIHNWKM
ncbi:MAG: ISAzo13 family transposase [Deltaproteobacteria bacterium]|nr:ISAzo13 family transposase [Deltaproteobacteria bacterium]